VDQTPVRGGFLVLELAADGIAVAVACRMLRFAKHAFYTWTAAPGAAARLG
jgi:hypothetical protein